MNYDLCQIENDNILQYLLDRIFFKRWRIDDLNNKQAIERPMLELNITPQCNLKCQYCYLQQNMDKIYPASIRNRDIILTNIGKIMDFLIANKYVVDRISLYSGEIWHTDFGMQVLDLLYKKMRDNIVCERIMIPTNGTFVNYPLYCEKMSNYIDKFGIIGVKLIISFSVDGLPIEQLTRPAKNSIDKSNMDEFYDNIFKFKQKHRINCGFHPMVSAYAIEHWIENFNWWMDMLYKNHIDRLTNPMMLEVRNDDWTDDKIYHMKKFTQYWFEYTFNELFKQDKQKIVGLLFDLMASGPNRISLRREPPRLGCSIQDNLIVRCGDLAIGPCHRLSYPNLIYGYFKTDDTGKICGIKSQNVDCAIRVLTANPLVTFVKCDTCEYKMFCPKGCLGSQYECNGDAFAPIESVCKMEKTRINTFIALCEKYELFDTVDQMIPTIEIKKANSIRQSLSDISRIKLTKEFQQYEL